MYACMYVCIRVLLTAWIVKTPQQFSDIFDLGIWFMDKTLQIGLSQVHTHFDK